MDPSDIGLMTRRHQNGNTETPSERSPRIGKGNLPIADGTNTQLGCYLLKVARLIITTRTTAPVLT